MQRQPVNKGFFTSQVLALTLIFAVGALGAAPLAAQEKDSREARAELKQTEAEIAQLKALLDNFKQEMSGLESDLKKSESEIGRLRRESQEIEKQIKEGETRLLDLRTQAADLQVALTEQEKQIARQIKTAYMTGDQDYLKLVLNQDDPARVARMMRYYEYVSRARVTEMSRYTDTLEQVRIASASIAEQQAALHVDREKLVANQQGLQA
ncbi:MAG: hypothetical protein V7751_16330, partial [Pseudoalteromonas distincta]